MHDPRIQSITKSITLFHHMILLHAVDSDLDKDTFNEYLYSVFSDSSSDSSSAPLNADDLPQHQLNIYQYYILLQIKSFMSVLSTLNTNKASACMAVIILDPCMHDSYTFCALFLTYPLYIICCRYPYK